MATRIGILLVHGIGEQRRFEHLEGEARNIASALKDAPTLTARVEVRTSPTAAFAAEQQTWQAEGVAPVMVEVTDDDGVVTELHFHEVWWADLDEPATLWVRIKFWMWGLSMWSLRGHLESSRTGYAEMRPPANIDRKRPRIRLWSRVRLFVVGMIILLILLTISLLNLVLRRVLNLNIPGPEILVDYIGDVKLFQQKSRSGKGPLAGLGEPPRVTLRRRMVQALVHMAMADYERWYVFAHSQGTVLAFNGLMETGNTLPNYLDEAHWTAAKDEIGGRAPTRLSDEDAGDMMPTRPAWLARDDIIDRQKLFAGLAGFMTYGSPLHKFAVLWPAIVPLKNDETVFRDDFEWINVYDATDPVADRLQYFGPESPSGPAPQNVSYKAGGVHLLSHIKYLSFKAKRRDRLVNVVASWLTKGGRFSRPAPSGWRWPSAGLTRVYDFARYVMWIVLGLVLAAILGLWFGLLVDAVKEGIADVPLVGNWFGWLVGTLREWIGATSDALQIPLWLVKSVFYIIGAALAVFIAGLGRKLRHWSPK